jgi:hypothetical protein
VCLFVFPLHYNVVSSKRPTQTQLLPSPTHMNITRLMLQLCQYDRFASPIVSRGGKWYADPRTSPPTDAELEKHLTVIKVNDLAHLWSEANDIAIKPLIKPDMKKDGWWEFVLLKGSQGHPSAIIVRIHHCIGLV